MTGALKSSLIIGFIAYKSPITTGHMSDFDSDEEDMIKIIQ